MLRAKASSEAVEELIGLGCARNAPAELQYEDEDGTILTGRVRLLGTSEHHILADRPAYLDSDSGIPAGAEITVHVKINGSRYQFPSVIEESARIVRLNARQMVPGIAMRKPAVIMESQRRGHLRISMVAYDPIDVYLVRPHSELPDTCSVDAQVIPGWITDLSVGGVSVLVDRGVLQVADATGRFYLTFVLPGVTDEFNMLGSVRHCRVVPSSDSLRIGLDFRPWIRWQFTRDQQRISRFVTEHERRLLRRKL